MAVRKHHSTKYALLLYDTISAAIDNYNATVGIFIDLSKAFDAADHNILLDKLFHYGISRPVPRILCGGGGGGGGVLTRPKWTKLPKCIFYCLIRLFRKVATHEKL